MSGKWLNCARVGSLPWSPSIMLPHDFVFVVSEDYFSVGTKYVPTLPD